MCIISVSREPSRLILTHNRDEHRSRKSSDTLITKQVNGNGITYPMDLQSKGTWIATSDLWTTAILNGAENYHIPTPPYKHSRGLFPILLMRHTTLDSYFNSLEPADIEPFTQIIVNNHTHELYKLSWDGEEKSIIEIHAHLFVQSSSTLYSTDEKEAHKEYFNRMISKTTANLAELHEQLKWTHNPQHSYIKTTSRTQVVLNAQHKTMCFSNFSI